MVELVNVSKKYKDINVLDDISYAFLDKGIYLLQGESGCGKTTLLKIISGRIKYDGEVKVNSDIFFLPFNDYLINQFKVSEMIKLENEIYKNFKMIKDELGIEELKHKKVSRLSLGEKQRVGIYLAMCSNCKVVLLDEPLAGLDKKYRRRVINIIKRESKKRLFIIASHDFTIADSEIKLLIKDGKLIGKQLEINKNRNIDIVRGSVVYKWGLLLHFKQIFSRLIFIVTCFGIISFINNSNRELDTLYNDLNNSFSNELIYYKSNDRELNEDIFYDVVVSSFSREIDSYFIYNYSEEMYDSKILVNNYYIGNGFLFSNSMYVEGINNEEVILEINKNDFCVNNKLFYCGEELIKETIIGSNLVYEYNGLSISLKIKDIIVSDVNMIYLGDLDFINNKLSLIHKNSNIYNKYVITISDDKIESFYNKLLIMPSLQYYDFIPIYSDQDYSSFLVEISNNTYFHLQELNAESFIACSDIGFSCNTFEFSKFKSLVYINDYNIENKIYYKNVNYSLSFNEVIISKGLKEYLDIEVNDLINLKFYFDDEYHVLDSVRVVDVVEDEELTIYHSDYDFNLFKEKFNKNIRIEYVYSDEQLNTYNRREALYYEIVKDVERYSFNMIKIVYGVVYFFSLFMMIIMFVIEGNKLKRHREFFSLLYYSKVNYDNVFNTYMIIYLFCSLIYLNNFILLLIYLFCFYLFYKFENKKIRSMIGP